WARVFKVRIFEFSIGMGPKLISKKSEKTGISYSLRALPIGGFVQMEGEDEESDDPDALNKKPVWQRMIIISAGAVMNLLLGFIIMCLVSATARNLGSTVVYKFADESASTRASGLMEGDRIIKVGKANVHTATDMVYEIMYSAAEPVDITVERNGETLVLSGVNFPTITEQGHVFGDVDFYVYSVEKTFGNIVHQSWFNSISSMKMIWTSLIDLARGKYGVSDMSGPVGVTTAVAEAASSGIHDLLYLTAIITINLGIFNLLPFPALDGGHILFLIIELIIRRPVPVKVQSYVNLAGMALLLALMAVVTFQDIGKLIH
nr:M50 family metallopeptidase [Clostridiales bacterium]